MPAFNTVKCTFRFISHDGDRWSEIWYRPDSVIGGTAQFANLTAYWDKRRVFLTSDKQLLSVRVSPAYKVPTRGPRLSRSFRLYNAQGQDTDRPVMGNFCRVVPVYSSTGHQREFPIHGLSAPHFAANAEGDNSWGTSASMDAFFTTLKAGSWQLKVLTAGPGDPEAKKITALSILDGRLLFTAPGLGAVAGGAKVIISGVKGYKASQFNGTWKVRSYDALTGEAVVTSRRFLDPKFFWDDDTGTVRLVQDSLYNFDNVNDWEKNGLRNSSHKTGNPFDPRRGRQSVKR